MNMMTKKINGNLKNFYFIFLPHCMASEILVPQPRIKSMPPALEAGEL